MTQYFDNHCHLSSRLRGGVDGALDEARTAGVGGFVTVGCDRETSRESIEIAARHDDVWATVGLHPHDAVNGTETIVDLLSHPKVMAVGECGLDYFYEHSPRDIQRSVFAEQIQLAHERRLPLVIHTRDAWDDTFDVLAAEGVPNGTIFHCFTGGPSEARRCLDLGAFLSFSGIVTFKTAEAVREAAQLTPLDRMLAETDSPFLAPVPHRGQPNVPSYVTDVVAALAATTRRTVDEVADATWTNAALAFRLNAS